MKGVINYNSLWVGIWLVIFSLNLDLDLKAQVTISPNGIPAKMHLVTSKFSATADTLILSYLNIEKEVWFDIIAFYPPLTNGADLDTIQSAEVYQFDSATEESLFVNFKLPDKLTSVDSLVAFVKAEAPAGDSVAFAIRWRICPEGSGFSIPYAPVSDTVDLGTLAKVRKRLSFPGPFSGTGKGILVQWGITRDVTITDNLAADAYLEDFIIYYH